MRHYPAGSGEQLAVSPEEMLGDMPEFQQQVARDVSTLLHQAQQEAAARYTGEPVTFAVQGEWGSFDTNGIDDSCVYAIGGFRYRTTARVVHGLIRELLVDLTAADRPVVYLHAYTA